MSSILIQPSNQRYLWPRKQHARGVKALRGLALLFLLSLAGTTSAYASPRSQADELLDKAGSAYLKSNYAQARALATQAIKVAPNYPRAHLGLGMALAKTSSRSLAPDALWKVREFGGTVTQIKTAGKVLLDLKRPPIRPPVVVLVTVVKPIRGTSEYRGNTSLPRGETRIVRPPIDGREAFTYRVKRRGTKEISRTLQSRRIVALPVKGLVEFRKTAPSYEPTSIKLEDLVAYELYKNDETASTGPVTTLTVRGRFFVTIDLLKQFGWQLLTRAEMADTAFLKDGISLQHTAGTNLIYRTDGANVGKSRTIKLPDSAMYKSLDSSVRAFIPLSTFTELADVDATVSTFGRTLRLKSRKTAEEARPVTPNKSSFYLTGTIDSIFEGGNSFTCVVAVDGKPPYSLNIDKQNISRWLSRDKDRALNALLANDDELPNYESAMDSRLTASTDTLMAGEAVRLLVQGNQIQECLAVSYIVGERVVKANGSNLSLSAMPNQSIPLGKKFKYRSPNGDLQNEIRLNDNSPVAAFINPLTERLFCVSAATNEVKLVTSNSSSVVARGLSNITEPVAASSNTTRSLLAGARAPLATVKRDTLATSGEGEKVLVWNTATSKIAGEMNLDGEATSMSFGADGRRLAVGRSDGKVAIWRAQNNGQFGKTPDALWLTDSEAPTISLDWSAKDEFLASSQGSGGTTPGHVTVWNTKQQEKVASSFPLMSGTPLLCWLPGTSKPRLLIADAGFPITAYQHDKDDNTFSVVGRFSDANMRPIVALRTTTTGNDGLIFAADNAGIVHLWEIDADKAGRRTSRKLQTGKTDNQLTSLDLSPDEKQLVAGDADGQIWVWNLKSGAVKALLPTTSLTGPIKSVKWTSAGTIGFASNQGETESLQLVKP